MLTVIVITICGLFCLSLFSNWITETFGRAMLIQRAGVDEYARLQVAANRLTAVYDKIIEHGGVISIKVVPENNGRCQES